MNDAVLNPPLLRVTLSVYFANIIRYLIGGRVLAVPLLLKIIRSRAVVPF